MKVPIDLVYIAEKYPQVSDLVNSYEAACNRAEAAESERDEARRERDAARAQLEQERKALTELQDLCPRMSDDDPIAPAIADCLKRYKAAQS